MKKIRTQFRLLDIYRIMQDGYTDKIAHVRAAEISAGGLLGVAFSDTKGSFYDVEFCNIDTIAMRKAAVKQINKKLKEASTYAG